MCIKKDKTKAYSNILQEVTLSWLHNILHLKNFLT